jgi:ATP-dependent Clp protease ATP-binding subunit ClpC
VVLAQEEARILKHNYIGTEHILLGLIHEEEGVAAKALEALHISLEAARHEVEEIIGHGQAAPAGPLPFTPRAKKVLELSLRESRRLGHDYIGTEHLLLGLIREGTEGIGAMVLLKHADLVRVRQTVMQLLSGYTAGKGEQVSASQEGGGHASTEREPPRVSFQEREKIVLALLVQEGMSTDGVADVLAVSPEKVREIVLAAIKKLKEV